MAGIVIVDRSVLSQNLFRLVLKPKGFSCYPAQTLEELKRLLKKKLEVRGVLISSNIFGDPIDRDLELLHSDPVLKSLRKLFLCKLGDPQCNTQLSVLEKSHVLQRPFHPTELYKEIDLWE